jgi:Icc-related predicted phosphoesterase
MKPLPSKVLILADYPNARFTDPINPPVDFILSCGDVEDRILEDVHERFRKPIFAVKGNHDSVKPFPPFVTDVHFRLAQCRSWFIGGWQGVPEYKPSGHFQWDDLNAAEALSKFPQVDIFICHAPLFKKTDRDDAAHQGSSALLKYVEDRQPKYVFHGHVHQRIGTYVGETAVVAIFGAEVVILR